MNDRTDLLPVISKQIPPWLLLGLNAVANIPLDRWLLILGVIYTALQIYVLVRNQIIRRPAVCSAEECGND